MTEVGTKLWIKRGTTDPESNCGNFPDGSPHSTNSGKTRFTKLLITIIIRAVQALSSFQRDAKAPEQSGVATLWKIWVFLQFSSTEKYSLEEEQQKRQNTHPCILYG